MFAFVIMAGARIDQVMRCFISDSCKGAIGEKHTSQNPAPQADDCQDICGRLEKRSKA